MGDKTNPLRIKLQGLVDHWHVTGLPGRQTLMDTARDLTEWKQSQGVAGLWADAPVLLTATLDDAWGHGIELIEAYARVLGMRVSSLGLEKSAREIISACKEQQPDYLGMTVLQFDSEDELCEIGHNIPDKTRVIVGGPIFKSDPEIAERTRVHFAARDVTAFIQYFLSHF